MKITKEWLFKKNACEEGQKWFFEQNETDLILVIKKLEKEGRWTWANWAIISAIENDNAIRYAIYAAEQVLHIFEFSYPADKRPKNAILAAKKSLKIKSNITANAAHSAAYAASAAAYSAAYSVYSAAHSAAYAAAHSAAYAATAAAEAATEAAAYAAYSAAHSATDAATDADIDAFEKIKTKIINYGIKLLKK